MRTCIPLETLNAYRAALYVFDYAGGEVCMRVGLHCAGLGALYRVLGCNSLGFVTACNPLGQAMNEANNADATAALGAELKSVYPHVFTGEGVDPAGIWREASFAVAGMALDEARKVGQLWRQNAILWAGADAVPRLELLR